MEIQKEHRRLFGALLIIREGVVRIADVYEKENVFRNLLARLFYRSNMNGK